MKKSCSSLLTWMTRPAIPTNPPPLPSSPTMNDAQEETDDMEWEEMGREEKLEIVRKKKEHWEVTRNARAIIVDLLEDAMAWAEEKPMRQLVNEIVLEGWRKMEIKRINNIIVSSDTEVQRRLMEGWVEKKSEEDALLLTLRLEEERQERLARIQLLKEIMKRKWDAKKLRQILRMMKQMSLEDLAMEVDEVEARALEMIDMDVVEVTDESDMSVLEDGPCVECVSDQLMEVVNAEHVRDHTVAAATTLSGVNVISGDYQTCKDERKENTTSRQAYSRGNTNTSLGWRSDREEFGDITVMISRWETQEEDENTPVVEMVRKRRRSANLDRIVVNLNLEPDVKVEIEENSKSKYSSGGQKSSTSSCTEVAHTSLLDQTFSLQTDNKNCGKKRKSEREDYKQRKRWRGEARRGSRLGAYIWTVLLINGQLISCAHSMMN